MRVRTLLLLGAITSAPAVRADTLTGAIDDPALRRTVDLVYIERIESQLPPPGEVTITQRGLTFLPHVVPVVAGARVVFKSEDPELHNVFARGIRRALFNQSVMPNEQFVRVFRDLGPIHLTCNIHKEMSAWVVVLQNPFFARPDKEGQFTISGVPRGQYTVRIWGEALEPDAAELRFPVVLGPKSAPLRIGRRP